MITKNSVSNYTYRQDRLVPSGGGRDGRFSPGNQDESAASCRESPGCALNRTRDRSDRGVQFVESGARSKLLQFRGLAGIASVDDEDRGVPVIRLDLDPCAQHCLLVFTHM